MVSKRHHYTPRYYLKRFEDVAGVLWRLDVADNVITRGNHAHFGYQKHWNSLRHPLDGYPPDWAEQRLAEVDGLAAAEIARIVAGDFSTDLRAVACAIAFMTLNNPSVMRNLNVEHGESVANWSDDFRLIAKFKAALSHWESYRPYHYSLQVIDAAHGDARFLTSSNPLIDMVDTPSRLLPISSHHCLFLSRDPALRGITPRVLRCGRARVAEINALTKRNAWQYLYSNTADFGD